VRRIPKILPVFDFGSDLVRNFRNFSEQQSPLPHITLSTGTIGLHENYFL